MASERMEKLRGSTVEELRAELHSVQRALFGLRTEISHQASENTAGLRKLRREIAQVKTVINEKSSKAPAPAGAAADAGEAK